MKWFNGQPCLRFVDRFLGKKQKQKGKQTLMAFASATDVYCTLPPNRRGSDCVWSGLTETTWLLPCCLRWFMSVFSAVWSQQVLRINDPIEDQVSRSRSCYCVTQHCIRTLNLFHRLYRVSPITPSWETESGVKTPPSSSRDPERLVANERPFFFPLSERLWLIYRR